MYININKTLNINDLPTIASLSYLGFPYTAIDKQANEILFIYKRTQKIIEALEKIQKGKVKVDPILYSNHLKKIKTIIYQNITY